MFVSLFLSLPADLRAVAHLSSAADANDDDDAANHEEDSSTTHLVHLGLQFCASQHTDRVYLYTKVPPPVPECDYTNWITARLGSLEEQKCVRKIFPGLFF